MVRPVFGGNAHAAVSGKKFPQIATIRPKAIAALGRDDSRTGQVVIVDAVVDPAKIRTELIDRVIEAELGVKIEEADVVVCGGRGMGGPDPFTGQLRALAQVLDGVVAASRPPADDGWVPAAFHIGLTGKIVAPNVYFAVGVSGASQHIAGCSGAKTIIAINKDPEAYVFKHADYGRCGKMGRSPAGIDPEAQILGGVTIHMATGKSK